MAAIAFDLFPTGDLEKFMLITNGLFTEQEYIKIQVRICTLWETSDQWDDILNSLTTQQKYNLEELVGTPRYWPFTPIIALDENIHAQAIMMMRLSDCGIEVGRDLDFDHPTVINLTSFDRFEAEL